MITILEHTIEETIINKNGWILDLGCVNFEFSTEMKKYCNNVICVDPNPNIKNIPDGVFYENVAITCNPTIDEMPYYIYNDINGYSLMNPQNDICHLQRVERVKVTTIEKLMKKYGISKFELIKFDIEGSEYSILENIDWKISKQYSIEFHDFRNMNPHTPNNEIYYTNLLNKIEKDFVVVKHNATHHPGFSYGMGYNYWDSLFVEKI